MRILHVIATMNPASGGPAESVRTLMTFGDRGFSGEVVTMDDPEAPFLKSLSFPVHALGPVATTYGYTPKLRQWLDRNYERFDGVVVNGLWNYCGVAAWKQLGGVRPYVVFTHGMLDPYFKRAAPLKHAKKWAYWLAAQYWVLAGANQVLFTTKEESRLAKQSFWLHRWNALVVPYGSGRPPATADALRKSFFSRFPQLEGKRFMLFLGRIHRKKGCDMLVRSFARHAKDDPGLHLVMAGPDEQGWSAELQAIVADAGLSERVHWLGMLRDEVKWGSLCASEVFILPSHQENFGIAVAEALACGKAVLLSDQVNIAPQIAEDGAGWMEKDDQAGTDALVRRWIGISAEKRAAMEAQALVTFRERYDMGRCAAAIVRLFTEEILRQHQTGRLENPWRRRMAPGPFQRPTLQFFQ
jgi:glycosyltransferase involved in cell wall biosynthesis